MRKLLLGSAVLCIFAISIALVQVSCSKSKATPLDQPQVGKIIFMRESAGARQLWIANYDGSNQSQVPINLPVNVSFDQNVTTASHSISPDGQTIFFTAVESVGGASILNIYSCDISGSNIRVVIPGVSGAEASYRPVAF